MFDKLINLLLGTAEKVKELDVKTQQEITKYNNRQIKKTAIVCFVTGVLVTVAIQNLLQFDFWQKIIKATDLINQRHVAFIFLSIFLKEKVRI